jgi:hypothetical protein
MPRRVKEHEIGRECSKNEKRNARRIFVAKPERKKPLGRPKRRWVDNIKIDIREIGWGGINWINLSQVRDRWRGTVDRVIYLWIP